MERRNYDKRGSSALAPVHHRYVRTPEDQSEAEDSDECSKVSNEGHDTERSEDSDVRIGDEGEIERPTAETGNATLPAVQGKHQANDLTANQPVRHCNDVDRSWNLDNTIAGPSSCSAGIAWQNIPTFPDGITPNKMWQKWHQFKDRFETVVSLSNISSPVKPPHHNLTALI